jgi:hypothetical protein
MTATMAKPPKKPEPLKATRGPSVMIRPDPKTEAQLQAFIAAQRVKPDRAAVVMLALQELLVREGFRDPTD